MIDKTNFTFIDSPVLNIIDYFSGQLNSYLSLALQLGSFIAILGIIWQCFQMVFGTLESRKFIVGSITKWFLFLFILVFYPGISKGLKSFALEMPSYVSGSNLNEITSTFGKYLEKVENTLLNESQLLDDKIKALKEGRIDIIQKTDNELANNIDSTKNEIWGVHPGVIEEELRNAEEERQKLQAVIDSIDTDKPKGAARIINALHEVLIIDDTNTINKYKLDLSLRNSKGEDSGFISPNAMLRISLLSAQVMWQKVWEEDVIATWEKNSEGKYMHAITGKKQLKDFPFNRIFDIILCWICEIFVVVITCIQLIQYVMCIIEFVICISFGVILVPTLLFDGLKDMAMKLLPSLLAQTVKLSMITICMFFCCYTYMDICSTILSDTGIFNIASAAYVFFTVLLSFALCSNAPKLASALLTGQPQLSMGEFVQTAGAIAGGTVATVNATRSAVGSGSRFAADRLGDMAAMAGGAIGGSEKAAAKGKGTIGQVSGAIGGALGQLGKRTGNRVSGAMQNAATFKGKGGGFGRGGGGGSTGGDNRFTSNSPMWFAGKGENSRDKMKEANQHSMNYGTHVTENGTKSTLSEYLSDQFNQARGKNNIPGSVVTDSNSEGNSKTNTNPVTETPPPPPPNNDTSLQTSNGNKAYASKESSVSYHPMIEDKSDNWLNNLKSAGESTWNG